MTVPSSSLVLIEIFTSLTRFRKICADDGSPRALYSSNDGTQSYLWMHNGSITSAPITDIIIIFDEEPIPEGYERINKNICKGLAYKSYICILRRPNTVPLTQVKLFYEGESDDTYTILPRSVAREGRQVFLGFTTTAAAAGTQAKRNNAMLTDRKLPIPGTVIALTSSEQAWMEAPLVEAEESTWATELPMLVEKLLCCSLSDKSLLAPVNEFFKRLVESLVDHLNAPVPLDSRRIYLLELLLGCNDACNWFFEHRGFSSMEDKMPSPASFILDGDYAKVVRSNYSSETATYSRFLVSNVNHFGALHGFDAILTRIEPHKDAASLHQTLSLLHLVSALKPLRNRFTARYFPLLHAAAVHRLQNLSHGDLEELNTAQIKEKISKSSSIVESILLSLESLHKTSTGSTEKLFFGVMKQYLTCDYLSLRVKGVSAIAEFIDKTSQTAAAKAAKKNSSSSNLFRLGIGADSKSFGAADLVEWLVSSDVLLILLGDEAILKKYSVLDRHNEILKRAEPIILFLADKNFLTEHHLELLCAEMTKASSEQHLELSVRILCAVVSKLPMAHLTLVYQRVRESVVDPAALDASHIKLFKSLSIAGLDRSSDDVGVGVLLDCSYSSEAARVALAEVLKHPSAEHHLMDIIGKAVCQVIGNDRTRALAMILLLRSLIASQSAFYQGSSTRQATREHIIQYAESAFNLTSALSDELQAAVASFARGEQEGCTLVDISARMHFIKFIIENSSLSLPSKSLLSLWSYFNSTAVQALTELFFGWLHDALPGEFSRQNNHCISEEVAAIFFERVMRSDGKDPVHGIDFKLVDIKGYLCIERLFRIVNSKKAMSNSLSRSWFIVEDDNLIGLSVLLHCVFDVSAEICKDATEFLVSLQVHLSPRIDKFAAWSGFVTKCMNILRRYVHLAKTAEPDVVDTLHVKISRALSLLIQVLEGIKKPMDLYGTDYSSGDVVRFTIFYRYQNSSLGSKSLVYVVKRNNSVTAGAIRARIAADLRHNVELVQIVYQGAAYSLSRDHVSFSGTQVYLDVVLLALSEEEEEGYVPSPPCKLIDEEPDSDQTKVRQLLASHEDYFESVFELIASCNASVAEAAWTLLDCIPINPKMASTISQFDEESEGTTTNWSVLLDDSQPFHLLYRLRIISSIVSNINDAQIEEPLRTRAKEWYVKFLQAGGLDHICNLLQCSDLAALDIFRLQKQILAAMLHLVELFISSKETPTPSPVEDLVVASIDDTSTDSESSTTAVEAEELSDNFDGYDEDGVVPEAYTPAATATFKPAMDKRNSSGLVSLSIPLPDVEIEWDGLIMKLLAIMHAIALSPGEITADHEKIILSSMRIIVYVSGSDTFKLSAVLATPELERVLFSCLLQRSRLLRTTISSGLKTLCLQTTEVNAAGAILEILLPRVSAAKQFENRCAEFFELLCVLTAAPDALESIDVYAVSILLVTCLQNCQGSEVTEDDDDELLQGYMTLLQSVFVAMVKPIRDELISTLQNEYDLIHELFAVCLFPTQDSSLELIIPKPKCKSSLSRGCAFTLLLEIAESSPEYFVKILHLTSTLYSLEDFDTSANSRIISSKFLVTKPKIGYVGLDNPGCICYMNSSLQQFYMLPKFREGILQLDEFDDTVEPSDNIIHQLQLLFANLHDTEMASISPRDFSFALKDYDGQPTDLLVQQDASEFLTKFFQQAEERLLGTNKEQLLKDCFGGMFIHKLTAEGGRKSERADLFFFISLEVGSGKASLEESLADYVKEEPVEYTWESTDANGLMDKQSLSTVKKTVIQQLPPYLLFHLRRFDFDYETFLLAKKNDRFEFPLVVNMFPYTSAAEDGSVDDGSWSYELTGVVVHIGTADSGHYYSFCRDHTAEDSTTWYEFNDSLVREFDLEDLDEEAFGGPLAQGGATSAGPMPMDGSPKKATMKMKNAFMLVYTKAPVIASAKAKYCVNSALQASIHSSNLRFWREKALFNTEFFEFMSSFLTTPTALVDAAEVSKSAFLFFLVVLVQSDDRKKLSMWSLKLAMSLRQCLPFSEWVLTLLTQPDNFPLLERLLMKESSHVEVNRVIAGAMESVRFLADAVSPAQQSTLQGLAVGLCYSVLQIADGAVASPHQLLKTICNLPYFFKPLDSLARTFPETAMQLIQKGVLLNMVSLLVFDHSYRADATLYSTDNLVSSSIQNGLVSAIATMLAQIHSALRITPGDEAPMFLDDLLRLLTTTVATTSLMHQIRAIYGIRFKGNRPQSMRNIGSIIAFAVYEAEDVSKVYLAELLKYLQRADGADMKDGFRLAMLLLEVQDNRMEWRCDLVLTALLSMMEANCRYLQATEVSIEMVLRIFKKTPIARSWLLHNQTLVKWMEAWLDKRRVGAAQVGSLLYKPIPAGPKVTVPLHVAANKREFTISSTGFSNAAVMLSVLRKYMAGQAVEECYYDSDDEGYELIGRRVEIKWAQSRYYPGVVDEFAEFPDEMYAVEDEEELGGHHRVSYDDGDIKLHHLATKTWRFI